MCIKDLTQGRRGIPVLSAGNVLHKNQILSNMKGFT
ncbi:unnamed protein product [Staurois parvus]|uniref:Uncharacterized protein n=1 Tax=Staurois parvus TaxID=386267 RepID=A0ABN9BNF8_9NEOB|nr:unnamed protein product [Staurois parvus]